MTPERAAQLNKICQDHGAILDFTLHDGMSFTVPASQVENFRVAVLSLQFGWLMEDADIGQVRITAPEAPAAERPACGITARYGGEQTE